MSTGDRCKCWHNNKRCVLKKHNGHSEPHKVLASAKEKRLGRHTRGWYMWNTGRIWPLMKLESGARGHALATADESARKILVQALGIQETSACIGSLEL